MRTAGALLLLVAAFALASWIGWWAVPLVAALWGFLRPAVPRPILTAALAGLLGWAVWLLIDLSYEAAALGRLGSRLAGVLQLPAPVLFLLTLLFPALLAWSSAALACGLAGLLQPRERS
jgi:hypothetical protein